MIPGILLAAGLSSRFGSQKLFIPFHGNETLLDYSLEIHMRASISSLIVVASKGLLEAIEGREGDGIRYRIESSGKSGNFFMRTPWGWARLVVNEAPETGMADSLKLGLSALSEVEREKGVLISLADMPKVTPEIIKRLIAEYRKGEKRAVVPMFGERIGHPVIFDEPFFRKEIQNIRGDEGLRSILKKHWRDVTVIPWEDASVVMDVDTPMDMEKILGDGV